jgi:hypothetical protein
MHISNFPSMLPRPDGLFTEARQHHPGFHTVGGIDLIEAQQDLMRLVAGDGAPASG